MREMGSAIPAGFSGGADGCDGLGAVHQDDAFTAALKALRHPKSS